MDGIFDTSDTSGGEDDFSEQYYDNDYDNGEFYTPYGLTPRYMPDLESE